MDKYWMENAELSKFSRYYMDLKRGLPIRPSEMGVLNILTGTPGPHTSVMMAERLNVSKPMITALLNSLLEKGYVIKEQSLDDKRIYYAYPTEMALELVASAREDTKQHLDRLAEAMGQADYDTWIRLTKIANQVFENRGA